MDGKDITIDDLRNLVSYALKTTYRPKGKQNKDEETEVLIEKSLQLFGKDYKYSLIDNSNGELCAHYPSKIIIPEYQISGSEKRTNESFESIYDLNKLSDLFKQARFARCRARFPVPVILFEGKNICRGATISSGAEMYGRSGIDFFFSGGGSIPDLEGNPVNTDVPLFDRVRGQDIKLLKYLSVGYICDLMVEKKKVKFGMYVTSSEKVDKEKRYSDFTIISAPYPGCEFFREWKDNGCMADGLHFDWNQDSANATLDIPVGLGKLSPPASVDWNKYKSWDLVRLTKNYLKLILHYVLNADSGIILHCISGWDRTPLFVSLLRLSLWADGLVHKSLNAVEVLYLTIAYDWFLFGHNFPERLANGEEIFYFCFHFLKYITEDMNVKHHCRKSGGRTTHRHDSESHYEGVLLDTDVHRCSQQGSNTSINSLSSRTSMDSCPVVFTVNPVEEEQHAVNGMPSPVNLNIQYSGAECRVPAASSTNPVPVPVSRTLPDHTRSPGLGSWQVVSGAGSLRGSITPHTSGSSRTSSVSSLSNGHHHAQCLDSTDGTECARKQKLDAVRRLFLSVYSTSLEVKTSPESSMLTGLLDHFAEKVGFKVMKGSPV